MLGRDHHADLASSVVWDIRLPRILLGLLVGACLGVAGTLMQAVFANPLAEPSIIGVTAGAGVGAALAIVFNIAFLGTFTTPFFAFLSALIATGLIYQLARNNGRVVVINLVLTGIAVNAVCGAIISFMVYLAPTTSREEIIFGKWVPQWCSVEARVGGASHRSDSGSCRFASWRCTRRAGFGDKAAGHTGINVGQLRVIAIVVSAVLTAGAVAFAGLIGFVGLIIPHLLRTVMGPENHLLIPASALGGAVLIGLSDVAARTMIEFADLPIGIFTALVGIPRFCNASTHDEEGMHS